MVNLNARNTYHLGQTPCCDDISGVYKSIEVPRRLLNRLSHLIVTIQVKDICDQVERILVVLDFGIEAREIKTISEVVFVDFAKIFVAPR